MVAINEGIWIFTEKLFLSELYRGSYEVLPISRFPIALNNHVKLCSYRSDEDLALSNRRDIKNI